MRISHLLQHCHLPSLPPASDVFIPLRGRCQPHFQLADTLRPKSWFSAPTPVLDGISLPLPVISVLVSRSFPIVTWLLTIPAVRRPARRLPCLSFPLHAMTISETPTLFVLPPPRDDDNGLGRWPSAMRSAAMLVFGLDPRLLAFVTPSPPKE